MKRILIGSAALVGAFAFLPATADARPGGGPGLGGAINQGAGGINAGGGGFRGGNFGGGGIGGAGLSGGGFNRGGPGLGGAINAGGGYGGVRPVAPGYGAGFGRGGAITGGPGLGGAINQGGGYGGIRPGNPGYGYNRPGYGHRYGWRRGGGWGYGGLGVGLGLGLAAGSYYGAGYGYPGYYDDSYYAPAGYYGTETVVESAPARDDEYCARRFKTYDPATGTYIGKGGVRRSCP